MINGCVVVVVEGSKLEAGCVPTNNHQEVWKTGAAATISNDDRRTNPGLKMMRMIMMMMASTSPALIGMLAVNII